MTFQGFKLDPNLEHDSKPTSFPRWLPLAGLSNNPSSKEYAIQGPYSISSICTD